MDDPALPPDPPPAKPRAKRIRKKAKKVGRQAVHLTAKEYLPMAFTIAFWALAALAIGHADAARLLAATVMMRGPALLSQMITTTAIRRRWHRARDVRRQAIRKGAMIQIGVVLSIAALIGLLSLGLTAIGQDTIAQMILLTAAGYPAKFYRMVDLRTHNRLFRLYTTAAMLGGAGVAWALGAGPLGYALAFGLRDYVANILIALGQRSVREPARPTDEPLEFDEVARHTVVTARRMITYRLTKNLLAVFGPFGNFAARTGRGLKYHSRLEPYIPHKRTGFALFTMVTLAIAAGLAIRGGSPLAMIAAAGSIQLSALSASILLWWRYLPDRDDPNLVIEDEDDD